MREKTIRTELLEQAPGCIEIRRLRIERFQPWLCSILALRSGNEGRLMSRWSYALKSVFALMCVIAVSAFGQASSKFKVLHAFAGGTDGAEVQTPVVLDRQGNVFNTTTGGGEGGYGTVFMLAADSVPRWKETILHTFAFGDVNGYWPYGVVLDSAGNLYGAAGAGGTYEGGTVFEMTPGEDGWTFQVLYNFCTQPECGDGSGPEAPLLYSKTGNLYGTATDLFELVPGDGGWSESVLYQFCLLENCTDGVAPRSALIFDDKGNLYGTTTSGGDYIYDGAVYKLRHMPDGSWKESVLHSFGGTHDGITPGLGSLAMDKEGNLYGTTVTGRDNSGIVYRLTRQPNGHWKEKILHKFQGGKGGWSPDGGVVLDAAGNLYGTTQNGGTRCDCGVIYELSPNPDDTWTYKVLHRFIGYDGVFPMTSMVFDDHGNLYGTTQYGGPGGGGVVFELTP